MFDITQKPQTLDDYLAMSVDKKQLLADNSFWTTTPLLNYTPLHKLKDTSLVRFRGMVQDMLDPEIYLESYEVVSSNGSVRIQEGKYRDCLVFNAINEAVDCNAPSNKHGERRTLFVVSLPGQNDWCKEYERNCNENNIVTSDSPAAGSNERKRPAPSENMEVDDDADVDASLTNGNDNHGTTASGGGEVANKRQCVVGREERNTVGSTTGLLGSDYLLNSPIPERPSKACIIKLYDDVDSCVLNELIDVIGFLSVHPSLDASMIDTEAYQDYGSASEIQAHNPPPSLIPRLHVIAIRKLQHANPLLDISLVQQQQPTESADLQLNMSLVHKDLRTLLSLCLFNDNLAADYLLSHLISTVYNRNEMQSVGKFTLNICNLPKNCLELYTTKLYEILELLLPASHYLPLTLDTMNTAAFVPKKDYETNKLVSGLLQLAPHTHLVLDETRLTTGKLDANGVMSVQHLAYLINNQQIKCDFQYYQIDYNTNIQVLVLSEGRSMLPSDFIVPIETDAKSIELVEETLKAANHFLHQASRLDQFRRYLTMARISAFDVTEADTDFIQNDFVEMRKQNIVGTGDELHLLLILGRFLSIASGKPQFNEESWKLAKEYEAKRRQRLKAMPQSKPTMGL